MNLGFVLEATSGQTLDDLLRQCITDKLGMKDTFYNRGNVQYRQLCPTFVVNRIGVLMLSAAVRPDGRGGVPDPSPRLDIRTASSPARPRNVSSPTISI